MEGFNAHLNEPQRESIRKLVIAVKGMHMADIKVRKDGQDIWIEADWLKHLTPILVEALDDPKEDN